MHIRRLVRVGVLPHQPDLPLDRSQQLRKVSSGGAYLVVGVRSQGVGVVFPASSNQVGDSGATEPHGGGEVGVESSGDGGIVLVVQGLAPVAGTEEHEQVVRRVRNDEGLAIRENPRVD